MFVVFGLLCVGVSLSLLIDCCVLFVFCCLLCIVLVGVLCLVVFVVRWLLFVGCCLLVFVLRVVLVIRCVLFIVERFRCLFVVEH